MAILVAERKSPGWYHIARFLSRHKSINQWVYFLALSCFERPPSSSSLVSVFSWKVSHSNYHSRTKFIKHYTAAHRVSLTWGTAITDHTDVTEEALENRGKDMQQTSLKPQLRLAHVAVSCMTMVLECRRCYDMPDRPDSLCFSTNHVIHHSEKKANTTFR